MEAVLQWMRDHSEWLWGLGVFSLVCFGLSLLALPWLVGRIPADYFSHRRREPVDESHPVLRLALVVARNVFGLILVVGGIAMLVLPGQGLLTLFAGLLVMRFPGKYALERRIVRIPAVLSALNWLRARGNHPPLLVDEPEP